MKTTFSIVLATLKSYQIENDNRTISIVFFVFGVCLYERGGGGGIGWENKNECIYGKYCFIENSTHAMSRMAIPKSRLLRVRLKMHSIKNWYVRCRWAMRLHLFCSWLDIGQIATSHPSKIRVRCVQVSYIFNADKKYVVKMVCFYFCFLFFFLISSSFIRFCCCCCSLTIRKNNHQVDVNTVFLKFIGKSKLHDVHVQCMCIYIYIYLCMHR